MSAVATPVDFTFSDLTSVLADNFSPVVYPANSVFFRAGESAGCAYLIERGQVRISTGEHESAQVVAVLRAGALFGEMALIDDGVRSATAVTLQETEVIPINRVHLQEALDAADPLVQLLVRELLLRLRKAQEPDGGANVLAEPAVDLAAQESIRGRAVEHVRLGRNLREALNRREFELHFQPIVRLADFSIAGFESLIRWRSPEMGFVPPDQFIGTAEDTGLIVPIGRWVLEHSCHVLQRLQARFNRCFPDLPPLFMSVNVSARQLGAMTDVENMVLTIEETGVRPEQLKLEITEGILVSNPKLAAAGLGKLKEIGASIAIDDFGTGYSSLSYLHRFPLDTLKIDRSFVSSMLSDSSSLKIVRTIANLAQELELDIVAEGVEEPEEVRMLSRLGCEYAQGYLFSKPKPVEQIMESHDDPSVWCAHVENLGLSR